VRYRRISFSQKRAGFEKAVFSWVALFLFACALTLLAACQVTPTPTPGPTPTSTRRPTRTPFPTLTPRASPSPTAAPIPALVTDTLRVREQPNTTSRILGRLKAQQTVLLLSRTDDAKWFSIEYPEASGQIGWIFGEIVLPQGDVNTLPVGLIAPKPPEGAIFARVKTEGDPLRMRAGPGTTYEIVARVPDTTRVLVVAKSADESWYQIIYPPDSGQRGWVSGEFLAPESSPASLQIAQAPPTPTPGPTPVPRPTRAPNAPTGGTVLVSSNRGGAYDIYALGENGVVRRQLSRGGSAFGARYSPDGERIVFYRTVASAPNTVNHIFVMNFEGSGVTDLSARAGGAFSDSDPDWSPDGRRIVFVRTPRAGAPELWTMNANGDNARRLLALSAATGVTQDYSPMPRWSPDGGRIAFAAVARVKTPGAPLYPNIFVVNANGDGERQLTDNDLINTAPTWSPDGNQIAWAAKDFLNRQNWRVWVMNASGADQRVLVNAPDGDSNNGVQPVAWAGNRLLLAVWTGTWNASFGNGGGGNLTPITAGINDQMPTDWLP
jgi:Tol biopolymer transport system component